MSQVNSGAQAPTPPGTTPAPIATPTGASPAWENTPVATMGYGARESADAKRQQVDSQMAHDEPEDINVNAVIARSQVLTFDIAGKDFQANTDARQKLTDANNDFRQKLQDRVLAKMPA